MDEFDSTDDIDMTDDGNSCLGDFDAGSYLDSGDGTDGSFTCDLYDGDDGQLVLAAFADSPTVSDGDESLIADGDEVADPEADVVLTESEQLDGQLDIDEYEQIAYAISNSPVDSEHGYWTGSRGHSVYVPTDPEPRAVLDHLGLEGIPFVEGQAVFDDVSACNITLTPEEMELTDAQHKQMLIDAYRDNEEELNQDVLDAFLQEDADTFATELDSDAIHPRFRAHHTAADEDGNYHLQAVPDVLHNLSHIGGRAESGTQNLRH